MKTVNVGFCIDILGSEEPVFSKPMLNAFALLEKKGLLHLDVISCHFASEYEEALHLLASRNQLVFCGPLLAKSIRKAANTFPNTFFVLLQAIPAETGLGEEDIPNLQWVLYKREETALLMGKICQNYPLEADFWFVTDALHENPMRLLEENAFIKGLGKKTENWSVLQWPLKLNSKEEMLFIQSIQKKQVFCVSEGAYVPSFLQWSQKLPQDKIAFIFPENASGEKFIGQALGSVYKNYPLTVETCINQVKTKSWKKGLRYHHYSENGLLVTLTKKEWDPALRKNLEKQLNQSID